jgi:ABC transport system ATP-binding/permease protein
MSSLIGIHELTKAFGQQLLFKGLSFTISEGDRIGLIGPNGSGKSTLLKIMTGLEAADGGNISRRQGLRIGYSSQLPEFVDEPLEEVLVKGLSGDPIDLFTKARILLDKMQFNDSLQSAAALSGGWKKRLDIARALMQDPDVLILDEPTNHLDIEGILWLEKFLKREKFTYVIVSHDRYFLENITNRVIELNRCYPQGLFMSEGNMTDFFERKEAFLAAQKQYQRGLASVVRDEVDWMRRSPKARTTKSRSRMQRAEQLIEELSESRSRTRENKAGIEFSASERETRKLLVAKNLAKSMGDRTLFKNFDLTLSPGTRLGVVGANGTGKTTLLKTLAGMIPPDEGTLKYAENIQIVYFDQHREQIPLNVSIRRALSPNSEYVNYRGQEIHVNGWAKRFLFSPERLELPVSCLSGGERARILIALLMLKPADILILDEPTNDLDITTLELLEDSLNDFVGAVLLISHDRCLMDNICTQIVGLGRTFQPELFADYTQWEKSTKSDIRKEVVAKPVVKVQPTPAKVTKKLSYMEQKELDGMHDQVEKLEAKIEQLQLELAAPIHQADPEKSLKLYDELAKEQKQLENLFERWQELENKESGRT